MKKNQETRSSAKTRKVFIATVIISLLFSVPLLFLYKNLNFWIFLLFLFLSFFYSSKPLRFKSKPFLDFSSNILYALPGFIGFLQLNSNASIDLTILLTAFCWTGALHLFSAIPDIQADSQAGINTTATFLGYKKSLMLCTFLWAVCALSVFQIHAFFLIVWIYPLIPFLLLFKNFNINKIYWLFPWINAYVGFLLYCYLILKVIDNPVQIIWPILLELLGTFLIIFYMKFAKRR